MTRRARLARAAEAIRNREFEIVTPEELAELRRPRTSRIAPTSPACWKRSVADDAARSDGAHRRAPVDFLVAAVAEQHHDVVLWAFDRDYRVIADVTGQPTELEWTSE